MDVSSSFGPEIRSSSLVDSTMADSFLVIPVRPSLTSTTSTPISISASASDTDISTSNSTADTPLGTSIPTTITTTTFLPSPANRERSGTVIARNLWDANGQQDRTVAPITLHHAQRSTNLSNATIVNGHVGRPSSSHSNQQTTTADNSPTHSTDTSRPETETEDDENVDVDAEGDVDMEVISQLNPISAITSSVDAEASTSTATIQSTQMPANASSPVPHRARRSVSRRAGASAAAVGIVSNDTSLTVTTHTTQPSHHPIIINEDLGDLGLNAGGVGLNVVGGVGVDDGIVSLDQQANEDFAMGAPPGAPGAIDATPTFSTVGVGRSGARHHDRHHERHHRETTQPDVTPRATVIGLPSSVDHSPLSISNSNPSSRAGAYHHTLSSTLTAFSMVTRGRSPIAPEPVAESLINGGGHVTGPSSLSRNGSSRGSGSGGPSTATGDVSPSSTVVANSYMATRPSTSVTSFLNFAPTTTTQHPTLVGMQTISPTASTSSNATAAANNTTNSTNFTIGTGTGATSTPSTAMTSGTTPTSVIAPQQHPGPYRDEDVLLGLQLLAYLSKYPHVRQAFYKTRMSFHPATVNLITGSSNSMGVGGGIGGGVKGKGVMGAGAGEQGIGIGGQGQIPPPVQKDRTYFKTFNGSSVLSPTIGGPPASIAASASTSGSSFMKNGKEKALLNPTSPNISASNNNANPTGPGTSTLGSGMRQTNVFSLVERFTFKPSSSELLNGSAGVGAMPRLPPEIQYWAGVVMRNACRKDDMRGGVRQCANSKSIYSSLRPSADESLLLFFCIVNFVTNIVRLVLCGRWEAYPREFAKCRRCRKAKYCGKECQSTAWSEGHRFWCSAKDVDEDGHEKSERHHDRDHHRDGNERDGDVEEESQGTGGDGSGSRRERRDRRDRERDRDRRDDGTDPVLLTAPATTTTIPSHRSVTATVLPTTRRTMHVGVVGEPPNAVLARAQQQSEQYRQALEDMHERRTETATSGGSSVGVEGIRMAGSTGVGAAGNDMVLG